ncbi:RNA polymerase sigma-70 factor (ECF subfamily) [Mucilaginibacter gracilis]|uniref:RNA polymerase sigma-70 factor (ECF subfamily) n=1 Tax=Mucilaginibacter gracilis TaxID=423350 RepID=A0A495J2D5_9SPHI|nr:sigma-70 family RNA polymerase sigma factor [Mucilaginibacter gracilis]RKR82862.1 RNA polymerase sigma-70 factor (ECF subfamily) [Mucilaginibacter gracilis]
MGTENLDITLLLQQLQLGSEQAFSKIYDLYSKPLYRNILYLVKDEDIAQEILQDLFLKLWLKREYIDPNRKWLSYLYEIANRMVIDHFRKVAKNQRIINHLISTTVEPVLNAEDQLIDKETYAFLTKAIESLPVQRKEAFKMCKIDGKSYKEAAELLGISPITIRNQIVAANKSLKEYFLINNKLVLILIGYSLGLTICHTCQYLL